MRHPEGIVLTDIEGECIQKVANISYNGTRTVHVRRLSRHIRTTLSNFWERVSKEKGLDVEMRGAVVDRSKGKVDIHVVLPTTSRAVLRIMMKENRVSVRDGL